MLDLVLSGGHSQGYEMKAKLEAEPRSLSRAATQRHLLYGTAICTPDLAAEPRRDAILRDCDTLTPEYELKWDAILNTLGVPGYHAADRLVAFAEDHGLAFHGHTLWWHESIPEALNGSSDHEFAEGALRHLEMTMGRYAGRLRSWDVVNEPLDLSHGQEHGLRNSRFLTALGPDYISLAYRQAASLDPQAILVLNEMGLEFALPGAEEKRRAMLALLERELAAGTPITCLGIQSHLTALEQPRDHLEFRAFLREIRRMGLSVMISEMDVSDHLCPQDLAERDRLVADTYKAYLNLVLEESEVLAVCTWGLSDDRTWLNGFRPRPDCTPQRPLPLDLELRRKPAWHAIQEALSSIGGTNH
jgi:endo-1,4-beta-xylanase